MSHAVVSRNRLLFCAQERCSVSGEGPSGVAGRAGLSEVGNCVRGVGRSWGRSLQGSLSSFLGRACVASASNRKGPGPTGSPPDKKRSHWPPWIPPALTHLAPRRAEQTDPKLPCREHEFPVSAVGPVVSMTIAVTCARQFDPGNLAHKSEPVDCSVFRH